MVFISNRDMDGSQISEKLKSNLNYPALTKLTVSENDLGKAGAMEISKLINNCSSLKELCQNII